MTIDIRSVPAHLLRLDGDTQPREAINQDAVTEYAELLLSAPHALPPVDAVFDGESFWVWDGFHRVLGAIEAEIEEIPVRVRNGDLTLARWLACSANQSHGLRRTSGDKRRAVLMALELHPEMSDPMIAEHVGVHRSYVQRIRSEAGCYSSTLTDSPRTGRDGKTYAPKQQTPEEKAKALLAEGVGVREVARETGIPKSTVQDMKDRAGPQIRTPVRTEPDTDEVDEEGGMSLPMVAVTGGKLGTTPGDYYTIDQWGALSPAGKREVLDAPSDRRMNDQGDNENIEWALWSWNPVTGCLHNCPYCYARDIANRFYEPKFEPSLWPARLHAPFNTTFPAEKAAQWMGHKNVFTCSMADLFGRWVPSEWIELVLDVARKASQWNFLFLTKFPQRMAEFKFPDNAWVGTTVDCQARVANAEKAFRKIKAGVKWLSCEPLIEPLEFSDLSMFDWVVLGGSSRSSQTPEWHPPRAWVNRIETEAERCGVEVYEKSNLLERIKGYPGIKRDAEEKAPGQLVYLPSR